MLPNPKYKITPNFFYFLRPGGKQAVALHWFPSVPLQVQESQSIVELIRSKIASKTGAAVFRTAQGDN